MKKINSIIKVEEIINFVKEEQNKISEDEMIDFVKYLEIDFYDWLKSNWNSFKRN